MKTKFEIIPLKLEYFIAKRLIVAKDYKSSISAPIIKIAVAAVALGMIMMIVSVATGIGLQKKIRQKVAAFNGHVIISGYNDNNSDISIKPISIQQKFYPKFTEVQGINHIQAVASKAGIVRTASAFDAIIFKGVRPDYRWENMKEFLVVGRVPKLNKSISNEVIISQYLANRLHLKLGDSFVTYFMKENNQGYNIRKFTICGIYNSGLQEFDSGFILGDIRHVQRINKWKSNEVGAFEIFLDDFSQINQKGNEIYEETSSTLDSQTIKEKYYFIFEWLELFDFNIILIIVVMIAVSAINVVVALLVLILERTQMIGILKSLGASNFSIRKIFLFNAFYLIAKGLFYGNLIALSLLFIQDKFQLIKLNPESYYVTVAPVEINFWYILGLNLLTIFIALSVMLLPTYYITKISPSKAIRYD